MNTHIKDLKLPSWTHTHTAYLIQVLCISEIIHSPDSESELKVTLVCQSHDLISNHDCNIHFKEPRHLGTENKRDEFNLSSLT